MAARIIIVLTLFAMAMVGIYALKDVRVLSSVTENLSGLAVAVEKPAQAEAPPKDRHTLSLLTWNVLVHPISVDKRAPALFRVMEDSHADVIALQEVSGWFTGLLAKEAWARAYYKAAADNGCGGQMVLSKLPVKTARCILLPGMQSRTALVADLDEGGGRLLRVVTTHAESALDDGPVRALQLDVLFAQAKFRDDAVVLGDFNAGDGAPERRKIPADYTDIWRSLRPHDPGFTWDNEKSDMDAKSPERFPGEKSRRLDWVLLRSNAWKPDTIRLAGDAPVVPGDKSLFPSDHFAVFTTLMRK